MNLCSEYTSPEFIHLRVHSAYSLLEGALPLEKILEQAVEDQQPAIAVTDTNNLFAAMEFSQVAFAYGVQPLIGCQIDLDIQDKFEEERHKKSSLVQFPSIVLFAANEQGNEHLVDLVSRMYLQKQEQKAIHVCCSWLEEQGTEGLIALTGSVTGPVDMALKEGHAHIAEERLLILQKLFGDRLYLELQRHGNYDRYHEAKMVKLAYDYDIPLVATNNAFFLSRDDYEAHDVLMAVAYSTVVAEDDRPRMTPEHYLKRRSEMVRLFSDLPEALENTVEVARRCSFVLETRAPILPRFLETGKGGTSVEEAEAQELYTQAVEGLETRLSCSGMSAGYSKEEYSKRLTFELDVIQKMKFSGYFLIVADFIKWAKKHEIPVGPGRGSGAGSLVAYALTITDVDPLRFALFFERFLNPDRMSMPDFDIDFCQDRRDEVIRYVQEKYGHEQVAQIITFGSLQARAALRDVGRALQMPYSQVDRICKLVPNNPAHPMPLAKVIVEEPRLQQEMEKEPGVARLLEVAQKLEGLYRHASTHAAGIVIGDRPLSRLVPMYLDPRSQMPVTQFNMKWVEKAGLVKFDFLGLKTLTVLKKAIDLVARKGIHVDLLTIPFDDQKTYQLLARGETVGVFQVESSGMRKALMGMNPDCIEDIIALVSLYRPGPMDNIAVYNSRKNGLDTIDSIHPLIDPLLKETQGVIIYQEQVMQIAQSLSGYSLSEADVLRRAMGKKIKKEMDQQQARFISGAMKNNVSRQQALNIFELLAKFANYGFNKSHAAAYAIISYQTAWMKAHYPVEFLAASMTMDMGNIEKINDFLQDAARMGIKVIPPSLQTSFREFETGQDCIYYSLAAIKGIGSAVVEHIVTVRGNKPFESLEDFCLRISAKQLNRRMLENLIVAGAFDCFGHNREQLVAAVDRIHGYALRAEEDRISGQGDIFTAKNVVVEKISLPSVQSWLLSEHAHREFQVLGFYLTSHPLEIYQPILAKMHVQTFESFNNALKKGIRVGQLGATVVAKKQKKSRKGNKLGLVSFSDLHNQFETVLFAEAFEKYYDLLEIGQSFFITLEVDPRFEMGGLRLQVAQSLEKKSMQMLKAIKIRIRDRAVLNNIQKYLQEGERGQSSVFLLFKKPQYYCEVEIVLPNKYRVSPEIIWAIQKLEGIVDVIQIL
ncbi:DNA polymerase III subunit alpha [Liberibacter crescens]|nr:DNA polymerase III subunit alpha [Liberibacter crescens]